MDIKRISYLGERGQSAVEYILLIAVIVFLVSTVLRNPIIQDLLDPISESGLGRQLKQNIEYSYRYGIGGKQKLNFPPEFNVSHPSYSNGEGDSRFFGPADPYPGL